MSVKKNLATVVGCVALAISLAYLYPVATQTFFVKVVFHFKKLEYDYLHSPVQGKSAGARAMEELLRMRPEPPLDDIEAMRTQQDSALAAMFPMPADVTVEKVKIQPGLKAYWVIPPNIDATNQTQVRDSQVILYVHGGSFTSGSLKSYGGFVSELARRTHSRVFFVKYRLAPEHPLPAAVDDVITAFRYLIARRIDTRKIIFVGDSAGGGLVLLALHSFRELPSAVYPHAAVTFSAWTDLYSTKEPRASYNKNKDNDAVLKANWLQHRALIATGTKDYEFSKRKSHKISAIYSHFPTPANVPILMQVGTHEILADDSINYAQKMKSLGSNITLSTYYGMQHVGVIFWEFFEEATNALNDAANWINQNNIKLLHLSLNEEEGNPDALSDLTRKVKY